MISNEKVLSIIKDLQARRQCAAYFSREDIAYAFCIRKLKELIENKKPHHEITPLQRKKINHDLKRKKEIELWGDSFTEQIREDY